MAKIDESKKLSMEELDGAAGGTWEETSRDSKFLNALTGKCDRFGRVKLFFSGDCRDEVIRAWADLGVTMVINTGIDRRNEYYIDGQKVGQSYAMDYAQKKMGITLDPATWDTD